jgi:hypothetical protein
VKVNPEDNVSFIPHWKRRRLELKMEPALYNTFNFKADKASTTIYVRVKISTVLALPLFN